jgi:hypothetical protein
VEDPVAAPVSRRRWTEESIRAALSPLLKDRTTWPTYDEFISAGAKGLRDAVARIHGAEWWASEMSVAGGDRRQGGVRRWSDATIRVALTDFLGDRSAWPTHREFQRAGHGGLYEVLRFHGGARRWAEEMGVAAPRSMRARPTSNWTDHRVARELATFLGDRVEWPRHLEFVAAGQRGLYDAASRSGGPEIWARRMGVRYIRRRGGPPVYWAETRIRERLGILLSGRDRWPTRAEFEAVGETRLLAAIHRRGQTERWQVEFGVAGTPRVVAPRARARPRLWTDAAITDAISPLIHALGRWPTQGEFRGAGLIPALAAVYRYGGSEHWQRQFGVTARQVPDRTRWTEQSIDRELRRVCRGRAEWPSPREFKDLGEMALYNAASKRGGIDKWRRRLALKGKSRVTDKGNRPARGPGSPATDG